MAKADRESIVNGSCITAASFCSFITQLIFPKRESPVRESRNPPAVFVIGAVGMKFYRQDKFRCYSLVRKLVKVRCRAKMSLSLSLSLFLSALVPHSCYCILFSSLSRLHIFISFFFPFYITGTTSVDDRASSPLNRCTYVA